MSPEEARKAAEKAQQDVMRELFSFLLISGKTPTTSHYPETKNEKETPDNRLN